ncbi:MAG: LLM class flavin-dependent oxidoreductase [bacterium]
MPPQVEVGLILTLTLRGLFLSTYDQIREAAIEAERWGFDSVWLCDHFFTMDPGAYARQKKFPGAEEEDSSAEAEDGSQPLLEAWTTLSALARDTTRLRLGTSVLCVGYRNPAVLAKMAATLDVISGGRLEMGIGAGWMEAEYAAYGFPYPKASVRIAQLEEAVQIMKRMWTDPHPTFEGEHFRIRNAVCDPPPVQKPHPPIWIGGEGKKVLRVAAQHADRFNARWWPPERFLERAPEIEAASREFGRPDGALSPSLMSMLIPEKSRADAEAERANYASIPDEGVIAGTPADCVARIRPYLRAGVRRFLFTIPNLAERPERLRLAGEEVVPAIRSLGADSALRAGS